MSEANEVDVFVMRQEFLKELQALLKKYDAQIKADDHWTGYAECGQDVRMTVEFKDYRIDDIDLGTWVDHQRHGGK